MEDYETAKGSFELKIKDLSSYNMLISKIKTYKEQKKKEGIHSTLRLLSSFIKAFNPPVSYNRESFNESMQTKAESQAFWSGSLFEDTPGGYTSEYKRYIVRTIKERPHGAVPDERWDAFMDDLKHCRMPSEYEKDRLPV